MLENALIVGRRIIVHLPCHGGAQDCPPVLLEFGTVFLAEQFFWTAVLLDK
jgi:hypothetical protein